MVRRGLAVLLGAALGFVGLAGVASPAQALPTPSGYSITGVDVSYFQGPSLDWAAVARGGAKFAYIRVSEQDGRAVSHNNPDPFYATNYAGARANGLYTGAYHRARPDLSSGKQQADVLLGFAPYVSDGRSLPPMLDIEWPRTEWGLNDCYNMTPAQLVAWIRDFVTEIAVRTGRQAMIYTNTNWWNPCTASSQSFAANPLFIANYSQNPPPLPAGWSSFTVWQHAAGTPIPGSDFSTPDLDVFKGDQAALARLLGGPATSLLATVNNRYVTAENAGASALIANRTVIGPWEQFDQIDVGGGFVAFRARVNGRYVTAENAGASPLIANRTAVGSWEKFRISTNADGTVSLLANANNRYVTAEKAGALPLIANRTAIGSWEKFRVVTPPVLVNLLANVNLRYVTAENGGTSALIANRTVIGPSEQFDQIDVGGGFVAFRARINGRYVTAENAGASPLIANRTAVGSWEKFRISTNADGTVSLLANANNRYVTAEKAGALPLIANRTAIGSWEKFLRLTS
ncbi:GH25 family lysozyme M1 (1,4-beta-N-acetylmuramidase) [Micromonospora kangleipakensis]|uniref:GH25 family lysozyme M1 (1,4-beta-N-acetylmuramidase) n=1 Tax=Micromonospora kangleipakensis TaxID=1077942 RepID=A0A4Q8BGS1_9ACTN|nr:GH25 family lysozyme [Micromonospora kangleipakensis]RZU76641.1 GH25 family lysozyme M1 (1,4-beta-N-acetylmuramidase) [Micromonospora kangleipakensis]